MVVSLMLMAAAAAPLVVAAAGGAPGSGVYGGLTGRWAELGVGEQGGSGGCEPGHYDHDQLAATACQVCPAGKFSSSSHAFSRGTLTAGQGDIAKGLPNGNLTWNNSIAYTEAGDKYYMSDSYPLNTTTCYFADCVKDCSCAVECTGPCVGPPRTYDHPTFEGENGIRICGNTRSTSMIVGGEPGRALDGDTNGYMGSIPGDFVAPPGSDFADVYHGTWLGAVGCPTCEFNWDDFFNGIGYAMRIGVAVVQKNIDGEAFWQVDLGAVAWVSAVGYWRQKSIDATFIDGVGAYKAEDGARVIISDTPDFRDHTMTSVCGELQGSALGDFEDLQNGLATLNPELITCNKFGRYITILKDEWKLNGGIRAGYWDALRPAEVQVFGSVGCTVCPRNFYTNQSGATSCLACPVHTTAAEGAANASMCLACAPGQFRDAGMDFCTDCEVNFYRGPLDAACTACPENTISEAGSASCTLLCARGFFINETLGACSTCPPNTFADTGSSQCLPCDPGWYASDPLTDVCEQCPPGTYDHDAEAATPCENCAVGRATASPGSFYNSTVMADPAEACMMCEPGTYSQEAATTCSACEFGQYDNDTNASTSCALCPAGKARGYATLKMEMNNTEFCDLVQGTDILGWSEETAGNDEAFGQLHRLPPVNVPLIPDIANHCVEFALQRRGASGATATGITMDWGGVCWAEYDTFLGPGEPPEHAENCPNCFSCRFPATPPATECFSCPGDLGAEPGATECSCVGGTVPTFNSTLYDYEPTGCTMCPAGSEHWGVAAWSQKWTAMKDAYAVPLSQAPTWNASAKPGCVDDMSGVLAASGTNCSSLLFSLGLDEWSAEETGEETYIAVESDGYDYRAACNVDLSTHSGLTHFNLSDGSLVRSVCPVSCGDCGHTSRLSCGQLCKQWGAGWCLSGDTGKSGRRDVVDTGNRGASTESCSEHYELTGEKRSSQENVDLGMHPMYAGRSQMYYDWQGAATICIAMGARMCTTKEISLYPPVGGGDSARYWSAEPCVGVTCGTGAVTTGGDAPEGTPCVFPWTNPHTGVVHHSCARGPTADQAVGRGNDRPFCYTDAWSTNPSYAGNTTKAWGYCNCSAASDATNFSGHRSAYADRKPTKRHKECDRPGADELGSCEFSCAIDTDADNSVVCCADNSPDPTTIIVEPQPLPTCSDCAPGYHDGDSDASTPCTACPVGTFANGTGSVECTPCPGGLMTEVGADSLTDCKVTPVYVGCFDDPASETQRHDLDGVMVAMGSGASMATCQAICTGYQYMGMQGTEWCLCGDTYGLYDQLNDDMCGLKGNGCGQNASLSTKGTFDYGYFRLRNGCYGDIDSPAQAKLTVSIGSWAEEVEWKFNGGPSTTYPSTAAYQAFEYVLDLGVQISGFEHKLEMFDSYGDGWNAGGYYMIEDMCGKMISGGPADGWVGGDGRVVEFVHSDAAGCTYCSPTNCHGVSAVFRLPYLTCGDADCGTDLSKLGSNGAVVTGFDSAQIIAACCDSSCATWNETNTCAAGTSLRVDAAVVADAQTCCLGNCQHGEWLDTEGTCDACPVGMFSNSTLATVCTACPVGSFAAAGATHCTSCAHGTYDADGTPTTMCEPCPSGSYSAPGSDSCILCAAGRFDSDSDPATPCIMCPARHYANSSGSTACVLCADGLTADRGAASCKTEVLPQAQTLCPQEWATCQTEKTCHASFLCAVASQDRPPFGVPELTALFTCLEIAVGRGVTLLDGCVDPAATNYAASALTQTNATCSYLSCAFESEDRPTACYRFETESNLWQTFPPDLQTPINLFQNAEFRQSLGQSSHVVLQGVPGQNYFRSEAAMCDYELFEISATQPAAERMCIDEGGHLASVHTAAQHTKISDIVWRDDDAVWIGMHDRGQEAGCDAAGFAWSDRSAQSGLDKWASSQPDAWGCGTSYTSGLDCAGQFDGDYDCVVSTVALPETAQGHFWVRPCANQLPSICTLGVCSATAATCTYVFQETEYVWADAESSCVAAGGHLASVYSADHLAQMLEAVPLGPMMVASWDYSTKFWIGLNDRSYEMGCDGGDGVGGEAAVCDPPTEWCTRDGGSPHWQWSDGDRADNFTKWYNNGGDEDFENVEPQARSDYIAKYACRSDCYAGESSCTQGLSNENCVIAQGGLYDPEEPECAFRNDGECDSTRLCADDADVADCTAPTSASIGLDLTWDDKACTELHPAVCGYRCTEELAASSPPLDLTRASIAVRHLLFSGTGAPDLTGAGGVGHSGGIACKNSSVSVEQTNFIGITQIGFGAGAIYAVDTCRLNVSSSVVSGNTNLARGSAGIYAARWAVVAIKDSRFEDNEVNDYWAFNKIDAAADATRTGSAAAIVAEAMAAITVVATRFLNNRGGAIVGTSGASLTLVRSLFRGNTGADGFDSPPVLRLIDGARAILSKVVIENNEASGGGGIRASGLGTVVDMSLTVMRHNMASSAHHAGGAALISDGALMRAQQSEFSFNTAIGTQSGGAFEVQTASLELTECNITINKVTLGGDTLELLAGAGGVHATSSSVSIVDTEFVTNTARRKLGDLLSTSGADMMYAVLSEQIYVRDTTFTPYDAVASVLYSPNTFDGELRGSCTEYPCLPSQGCSYSQYALSCTPCSQQMVSYDGRDCEMCPQGKGPAPDNADCELCGGSNHSTFGVCMPCPLRLVVDDDKQGCSSCGVHRSAHSGAGVCHCDDGFYNSTAETIHVCFSEGYDEDELRLALNAHEASLASTKQHCEACPKDAASDSCIVCRDGETPWVAAGFTIPVKIRSSRRQLKNTKSTFHLDDKPIELVAVFRCHDDMELAAVRCPERALDGICAEGYAGARCDSCADGYGMGPTRTCDTCEDTGYTGRSLAILLAMMAGTLLVMKLLSMIWTQFTLKHLIRVMFQPGRILITYSQITTQLGDVLDFNYPQLFGDVMDAIRPVMDLWGILFRALGPSECFGIRGFRAKWLLRVLGLPGLMTSGCLLYYVYNRLHNREGKHQARTTFKGHMFFVIFFCYPTICIISFAAFICRTMTPTMSVLEADGQVICQDPSHRVLQGMSYAIVVLIAIGLPLGMGIVLVRSARSYEREISKSHSPMATKLSEEMKVDLVTAEFVMRDVTIGQDYSFLMDAYVPRYLYWEAMDMLRKLILVGLVLLVGRGSIAQLCAAMVLSFAFFSLHMKTWPYKIEQDNILRATTEAHVFIVIMVALVLKQDLTFEFFQEGFYDALLLGSFIVCVPLAAFVAVISKLKYVRQVLSRERGTKTSKVDFDRRLSFELQALGLASDSDRRDLKRYIDGWSVTNKFAAFLSHYKHEAAAEARILKLELVRTLRTKQEQVFLDSDNLTDLRDLLECVKSSDAIILLYTRGVLSRPWCLVELDTAAKAEIPVIILRISNAFAGDPTEIPEILSDLSSFLAKENPAAEETLVSLGYSVADIATRLSSTLVISDDGVLRFDPHQSSRVMRAQVAQMAATLVEQACPENKVLLSDIVVAPSAPWARSRKYAIYIVHEQASPTAFSQASSIKTWLINGTDLQDDHIAVQGTGTNDKVALATDLARAQDADCVLVLQTSNILSEPRPLAGIYGAASFGIPIVPVVLIGSKDEHAQLVYNFETAKVTNPTTMSDVE